MYWVDIQLAQRKGLNSIKEDVMRSSFTTPSAYCISKVVVMESGEIMYEKVYESPRPLPKISLRNDWMKELDSEVAGSSKHTQRIQPKPKKLSRTERPMDGQESTQEIEKDILFGHEDIKHSTRTRGELRVDASTNRRRRSNKNGETLWWT